MKSLGSFSRWVGYGVAVAALLSVAAAQAAVGKAMVRKVTGSNASYSEAGGDWKPLKTGKILEPGASVRTGVGTSVVLHLDENGPTVSLFPDTTLGLDRLDVDRSGAEAVIDTRLDLRQGTIRGVVRKLSAASHYEVKTPNSVAAIRGTEYQISADGVTHVITGSVQLVYVNPVTHRQSTHLINQGQTFIPPVEPARGEPTLRPTRQGEPQPPITGPGEDGGGVVVAVIAPSIEPFVSPIAGTEGGTTQKGGGEGITTGPGTIRGDGD